ncbi:MAG TPA: hypothetical protein VGA20_11555, partial [Gemmatimonadales bacterium]
MKRIPMIAALVLSAGPLAAQQAVPTQTSSCGVPGVSATAPERPMGQCSMMQQGACPMMRGSGQLGPGHGAMPMRGGSDGDAWSEPALAPIHDALTFCPSRILGQKDVLELTGQQEVRLTDLLESAQRAIEAAQAEAQTQSEALSQALRLGKPDIKDVERTFQALHRALGAAHMVRLRTSIQARAVLTDEQREQLVGQFATAGGCGAEHGHP